MGQLEIGEPRDAFDVFDGECGHTAMLMRRKVKGQKAKVVVAVADIAVANPVTVAGPRCDGVVDRWPLGSGGHSRTLKLAGRRLDSVTDERLRVRTDTRQTRCTDERQLPWRRSKA